MARRAGPRDPGTRAVSYSFDRLVDRLAGADAGCACTAQIAPRDPGSGLARWLLRRGLLRLGRLLGRRLVVTHRVVELDEAAVDRADRAAERRRPVEQLLAADLEQLRIGAPHLRDQRVQAAADPEAEHRLEDRDDGGG